jgi:GNAT superfamily N-acetyltransferase
VQFVVRERTSKDIASCVAGARLVHESDGYPNNFPEDPSAWLQSPRQRAAWVAEASDGSLVGHVALNVAEGDPAQSVASERTGLPAERLAVVSRLYVWPDARHSGVASALLERAVAAAHAEGTRPVLDVLEKDAGAIAFYERSAWTRTAPIVFTSPRTGERMPAFVFAGPLPPGLVGAATATEQAGAHRAAVEGPSPNVGCEDRC